MRDPSLPSWTILLTWANTSLRRKLDDSELDSGDDADRTDRVAATVEDDQDGYGEQKQLKLLDVEMARVKPPEGDEV